MTTPTASSRPENSTTVRTQRPLPFQLRAAREGLRALSRVAPEGAAAIVERMFLSPRRHPRPQVERDLLRGARTVALPTKHGRLAAWEWGTTGPRVLLVHGWEGRGSQLGALAAPLVALGFRVVAFDTPGHGDSPGERSSFFHFADAIEAATRVLGPFHAVVAHSMGGATLLWANRLVPVAERFVMIAPPRDLGDFTRSFSKLLGLPEDVRARVHRRIGARFGVSVEAVRAEPLASGMRGPLLVVHDEEDREVPVACGEAIAKAWPGAELVRTRGLGHQRILRDPATLQLVARFVAQPGTRDAARAEGA
jgi:pimeloyl-ACP methyl ester carboxylesterase